MRLAWCATVNLGGQRARAAWAHPERGWFESEALHIHRVFHQCASLVCQGPREEHHLGTDSLLWLNVAHIYNVCYGGDSLNDAKLL